MYIIQHTTDDLSFILYLPSYRSSELSLVQWSLPFYLPHTEEKMNSSSIVTIRLYAYYTLNMLFTHILTRYLIIV